jgi:N-acylglucosamine-6-phosphate 2-epimerase
MQGLLEKLRGGLIVSCQAEGDDPFNQPEFIALFARAAEMGGAAAIRAREPENIRAVHAAVGLPVIGITKDTFPDGSVLITPDFAPMLRL